MPVGVKAYLDSQMASSKDKKFHVALNGKDLALTPIKIREEKKLGGVAENRAAALAEDGFGLFSGSIAAVAEDKLASIGIDADYGAFADLSGENFQCERVLN